MKKTIKMENLDCANCAMRMEQAVRKLNGVNACEISFMLQKMKVDIDEGLEQSIVPQILKACKTVDSDVAFVGV